MSFSELIRIIFFTESEGKEMENWIKKKDYAILIYSQENRDCYNAAMKALNQTKKAAGWDRIQGVTILSLNRYMVECK